MPRAAAARAHARAAPRAAGRAGAAGPAAAARADGRAHAADAGDRSRRRCASGGGATGRGRGGDGRSRAEKGYIKETGNLLFHFALLAILVGVGLGSWYGWHGNRLLVAGADRGFCNTLQQYDEYALGPRSTPATCRRSA